LRPPIDETVRWEAPMRVEMSCGEPGQDRGQAALVVVIVTVVLFVAGLTGLSTLGVRVTDQARAQSVADAAALAWVESGRVVAEGLVARAGADVVSWSRGPAPGEVTVVVRLRAATATARATNDP
jgi:Tfp pilus assembly protein PilV